MIDSIGSPAIHLQGLSKSFVAGTGHPRVLSSIDLQVALGEFVAIVGPSGCGKSTLLRVLAGLDTDYEGIVHVDGEPPRLPSGHLGMVFQEPRLFPWLSVAANVGLGLERLRLPRVEAARRIKEQLHQVGLLDASEALPHQLSGGMAQRVSLARALITRPDVLLLDEPFSALDALTKSQMHTLLLALRRKHQLTALMVTHDIEEAIYLADRVIVMAARPGRIQHAAEVQLAHPRDRGDAVFRQLRQQLTAQVGLSSH
ncbi:ABC transporter ATP-binding protein [Frateuria aurantia]